jgi:hypothetical protein
VTAPAVWSVTVPTSSVDADGKVVVDVVLTDGAADQGTLELRVTAGRVMSALWTPVDGAVPVSNRGLWSTT